MFPNKLNKILCIVFLNFFIATTFMPQSAFAGSSGQQVSVEVCEINDLYTFIGSPGRVLKYPVSRAMIRVTGENQYRQRVSHTAYGDGCKVSMKKKYWQGTIKVEAYVTVKKDGKWQVVNTWCRANINVNQAWAWTNLDKGNCI